MELGTAVTTVKGDPITVADVILHLKAKGTFRTAIYEIIERRVVEYKLAEHGVSLTDAEIEERVHGRKTMLALWDENAFASYLKHFGLTREQWLDTLAADMRRERLRDLVVTKELVQNHYRQNSARFTSVSIARIACRTRADAPEIDGNLFIDEGFEALSPGDILTVTVDEAGEYDLWGRV